ncbi:MAG: nitrilase-related carbon-nitrogen hydrolase [Candidatus Margulisiibacteriota bacterium]
MLNREKTCKIILFLLGLVLASLSFPSKTLWFGPLAWIGFVPLLYVTETLEDKKALLVNWLFFLGLLISLFWLNPFVETRRFYEPAVYLLLLLLALVYPLLYASVLILAKRVSSKYNAYLRPFLYAGFWVSLEYLFTILPFCFPFSLAITQTKSPLFLQLVPFLGIYGVSFLLISCNVAIFQFLFYRKREFLFPILMILFLNTSYGLFRLALIDPPKEWVKVGIVQPNVNWEKSLYSNNRFFLNISLAQLFQLSAKVKKLDIPQLIVWPELSANCYLLQTESKMLETKIKEIHVPLLVGTYYYDYLEKKTCNAAALISEAGNPIGIRRKNKLFPFFEDAAYKSNDQIVPLAFDRGIKNIGAMLCFESLLPQVSISLVKGGADALVLMANGAWFGETRWPYLHMGYIVFRALETGRWAVQVNNSGPTLAVSPQGLMSQVIPTNKTAVAVVQVASQTKDTFYVQSNEMFPKLILILSYSLFLLSINPVKGVRKKD